MPASDERYFGAEECFIGGQEMELVRLEADFGVHLFGLTVISDYEVSTRGRVLRLAPVNVHDMAIHTGIVTLHD